MRVRLAAAVLGAGGLLAPMLAFAQAPEPAGAAAVAGAASAPSERARDLESLKRAHAETVQAQQALEQRIEALEREESAAAAEKQRLEQRVAELETEKAAHEDATRTIIAETLSTLGTRINEYVDFGGVIEILPSAQEDFRGAEDRSINLNTLELQFEVQATDWARGSFVFEVDDGGDLVFTTTEDDEFSIDRVNVDTAYVTVGDTARFWPYASIGRQVVPFGISTGDPVTDVLNIVDPLTVEVFETRRDAIIVGFEFPTPDPTPPLVTEVPPPVQPLLVAPLVGRLSRLLGYRPPPPPPPVPAYEELASRRPPFTAGVVFFRGDTFDQQFEKGNWDYAHQLGAMAAYRTRGTCRSYFDADAPGGGAFAWLRVVCPWTLDLGVEFTRSVFESDFLSQQYRSFLGPADPTDFRAGLQSIGFVPGMAASLRTSLGPVAVVAEWNGAIQTAQFQDDTQQVISIRPAAWQVSLAYQFGWRSTLEAIGSQGTYATVSYSESRDLAGVQRFNPNDFTLSLVGTAPKRRLAVGIGEWVLPNLRLAVEYARAWDYSRSQPGFHEVANAVLSQVTFEW